MARAGDLLGCGGIDARARGEPFPCGHSPADTIDRDGYNHGNPLRTESAAAAAEIDARLVGLWGGHPRRFEVPASRDFLEKAARTLEILRGQIPDCCRGQNMRVLLAVDGSACSDLAVQAVIDRFRPDDTQVRVLHAVEWMREMPLCFHYAHGPTAGDDVAQCREGSFDRARGLVERIARELEFKGFHPSVATPDADPRHAIVNAARAWPADLIVIGSHGRRGIDRLLIGSVAESVVRHAPCSVDIVRMPVAKSKGEALQSRQA